MNDNEVLNYQLEQYLIQTFPDYKKLDNELAKTLIKFAFLYQLSYKILQTISKYESEQN